MSLRAIGKWSVALVLCVAPLAPVAAQGTPPVHVQRLVVHTYSMGGLDWNSPYRTLVVVTRQNGRYHLSGITWSHVKSSVFSGTVDARELTRLVAALRAPLLPMFSFKILGTQAAVAREAVRTRVRYQLAHSTYTPGQKALLTAVMANPVRMAAAITRAYAHTHSDDYPVIKVEVTMSNHTTLRANSVSQHLFLTPWAVDKRGKTWSPAIAQALHAILPAGAVMYARLGGFLTHPDTYADNPSELYLGWRGHLYETFVSGMHDKLAAIGIREQAGSVLALLAKKFDVNDARYYPDTHGATAGRTGELAVTLTPHDVPSNLHATNVFVKMTDGHATDLQADLKDVRYLYATALHSPAVVAQVTADDAGRYTLSRLSDNVFQGSQTLDKALVKSAHPRFTAKQLARAVVLMGFAAGQTQVWIAFPDGRAVLLHLTFADKSNERAACVTPQRFQRMCIGAVFAADGTRVM